MVNHYQLMKISKDPAMIISNPEQHMTDLQQRLMKGSAAGTSRSQGNLFELIMNNKLASAPPSTVPGVSSSIPPELLVRNRPVPKGGADPESSPEKISHPQAQGSRIRMTVSAETPRIAVNEVRQKIDFQSAPPVQGPDQSKKAPPENKAQPDRSVCTGIRPDARHHLAASLSIDRVRGSGFGSVSMQTKDLNEPKSILDRAGAEYGLRGDREPTPEKGSLLIAGKNSLEKPKDKTLAYADHPAFNPAGSSVIIQTTNQNSTRPGHLAARFESSNKSGAIGYDRRGGTCYGIYQLSSRMGTMGEFLDFLDEKAPDISRRLRQAGPANTGGRSGAMPLEWKTISSQQPERFSSLQHEFIYENFYLPAARGVQARTGLEMGSASPALREVLWSTAVQHGVHGAMNIFERVADRLDARELRPPEREIIQAVYQERRTRFSGSTHAVQTAVQSRFNQEMKIALAMLKGSADTQA